jgi:hypothetical protein
VRQRAWHQQALTGTAAVAHYLGRWRRLYPLHLEASRAFSTHFFGRAVLGQLVQFSVEHGGTGKIQAGRQWRSQRRQWGPRLGGFLLAQQRRGATCSGQRARSCVVCARRAVVGQGCFQLRGKDPQKDGACAASDLAAARAAGAVAAAVLVGAAAVTSTSTKSNSYTCSPFGCTKRGIAAALDSTNASNSTAALAPLAGSSSSH